jgi:formate/nitrite transporter FocA (FNT family)
MDDREAPTSLNPYTAPQVAESASEKRPLTTGRRLLAAICAGVAFFPAFALSGWVANQILPEDLGVVALILAMVFGFIAAWWVRVTLQRT